MSARSVYLEDIMKEVKNFVLQGKIGSKMGPNYACLFLGYVEEQIGQRYTGTLPQLHKRYIDDVVGIAC